MKRGCVPLPPFMHTLLIDNTDSFTWNLAQQIRSLGSACTVVGHNNISVEQIKRMKPDRIVLSPGPGGPESAGVSLAILRELYDVLPILGVCLGHQCMAHVFGGARFVAHAAEVMHGKTSPISHTGSSLFRGIPSPFQAARYHSLIVKKLPKNFELLAWTPCDPSPIGGRDEGGGERLMMAMRHTTLPLFGVQFHPESFLTKYGDKLMKNFLFHT